MSAGLHRLEAIARSYALAAVKADREGRIQEAIANYKKAIEVLAKIVSLYPDNPLAHVYRGIIQQYQRRVEQLEKLGVPATPAEAEQLEDWIVAEKPKIRFSDIADLEHAKQAIREAIIYPVRRPELFPLGWPRGILLFGPPGCGKTMLAAAVANEVDGVFFNVDAATIMSKWLGEAEKRVRMLFEKAREVARSGRPAIIFIDEIDALLGVYESEVGGEVRVRNQFLKEMDGLQDKSNKLHVYVIGATNKPWKLDEPFIRRFQRRIYIPPPDKKARLEIFKLYTRNLKLAPDVDLEKLAEMTEGYSASDIKDIVMEAHLRTIRELFEERGGEGDPRPITMEDFIAAIRSRRPSITPEMIRRYEEWYERFRG
ncbi:AAA family ATPase [Hyperthermus butylicus]|uniref:ATPase n=1 Tax=Hyperthermus butylicus (strain DSM 5456 / JCM 9403 / PLM1-5) TaxID=415426 RepID=A2BKZ1_HYPBU|nr:AAA family ATPase [Hyperthermus butylicus]ABM80652.1 putative ATPase [Hyperthermus butylicus DSM 5456]